MIKSIIENDELKSIICLKWQLSHFSDEIDVVDTFTDPHEAISYLQQNTIDCLFLDINMPGIDGFQLLSHLEARNFCVVFVTAFDQYAIKAIKEHAFDYLLKPVDAEELSHTISKIKAFLANRENKALPYTSIHSKEENQIKISVDGKLMFFKPDDILYCKSDGNYCNIYLCSGKSLLLTKKLKHVQSLIKCQQFHRVHHSYYVNLKKIQTFNKTENVIILNTGEEIPVSRSRKQEVLEKIANGL